MSPLIVVAISALFIVFLWLVQPDTLIAGMAAAVFGTSGTIVALALPAAELAGNSITRIGEYWIGRFAQSGTGSKERRPSKEFALEEISRIKEQALTARCGSLYVLCAFVISAFSLLTPRITMQGYIFYLDYTLVAVAAGFLLLGSALFFPFTWSVYRLDALEDAEVAIQNFPEDATSPEQTKAIKPPDALKPTA